MSYILIVDDDKMMAKTLTDILELYDYKVTSVYGPREAIQALNERKPLLILLDLNMKGVNGLEVCRYIKRDPLNGDIPVVFITAEDDPSIMEKAKKAGAMDYIVKPIDFDHLEKVLSSLPAKS
jgi:CheY-like chemotaxis protein